MSETDTFLTIEEIAKLMHVEIRTARERVRTDGFPAPLRGCGPRSRLWSRRQIESYMLGDSAQHYAREAVPQ